MDVSVAERNSCAERACPASGVRHTRRICCESAADLRCRPPSAMLPFFMAWAIAAAYAPNDPPRRLPDRAANGGESLERHVGTVAVGGRQDCRDGASLLPLLRTSYGYYGNTTHREAACSNRAPAARIQNRCVAMAAYRSSQFQGGYPAHRNPAKECI